MDLELRGRTAVVTGCSVGIGREIARVLAGEGVATLVVARRGELLKTLQDEIGSAGGPRPHALAVDLADRASAARVRDEALATLGHVDILVNNAGGSRPTAFDAPDSVWDESLAINFVAVRRLTLALLPGMIERRYGRIVNVASLAGLAPATAGHTLYSATKAFLIKFSQALAAEGARHGVHVTAVCPGFTFTEFHDVNGMRAQVSRVPRWMWMDAASVARQGYDAVMAGTPMYINGRVNRAIALLVRVLPQRLVNYLTRRTGGRYRNVSDHIDA